MYLPDTLKILLEELFAGKKAGVKVASIGQTIMQATRPRVLLAPLQFGLGVQLYHHFASRFLIDSLHHHGFCCSYQEVQRFEHNAAQSHGTDIPNLTTEFVQYGADNVDHNIRTLDGHGTFHGMGMIAAVTPETRSDWPILRANVTSLDVAIVGRVQIRYHKEEGRGMSAVTYQKLFNLKAQNCYENLDVLWKTSIMLGSPRPAWSGMMQFVHQGNHPGKASVMFLPIIDMNPSDTTCIYSTLMFVSEHARRHGVTPILTFDQPLWWKAFMIVKSEPEESDLRGIVLRLGGFHTEMSFLRCIEHLMGSSGLQEMLESIYAPNAVVHMLSGKAIARAVRAHFIVDAALNALILKSGFNVPLPCQPDTSASSDNEDQDFAETVTSDENCADVGKNQDLDEAHTLYEKLMSGDMCVEEVCSSNVLERIKDSLKKHSESMKKSSRTSALWVQYMNMIDILRKFIIAERTGNWELHLQAIQDMLPYMAASGHNLYTKSAMLYLQQMSNLKTQHQHPDVQQHFDEGLHVIRRSNRLWAGLSSDLIIEQVLMRSLKTSGGLTRGRGMTEHQRLQGLLTKDMTHQRRSKGKAGATVTVAANMTTTMKKEQFLANRKNKQQFIFMLSRELEKNNCKTHHASGDADLLIVQKAVQSATTNNTVLVGDDTDFIVLLCYHANLESHDLFFRPELKMNTKKHRIWNIKATKEKLGPDICNNILFIHAFLGCDTTSRIYGIGKGASLGKFKTSSTFREQAKVFNSDSASMQGVVDAGEKALIIVYNGKLTDTLDSLRHKRFCEKVASKTSHVKPQSLSSSEVSQPSRVSSSPRMERICRTSSNRLGMAEV